jgi:heme-degrading monooxygenase HmoA
MAVMNVSVITVKPGRMKDYLESTARAEELLTKAGAKNLRLMATLTAGSESGTIISTWEADDFTTYGKVTDAFFASGGSEVMEETGGEDSPIATWANSLVVDLPR